MDAREKFLSGFDAFARGRREPEWVGRLRAASAARFASGGLPTVHQEAWKYTNVAALARVPLVSAVHSLRLPSPALRDFALPDLGGIRMVFVNGVFAPDLSHSPSVGGVHYGSLAQAVEADSAATLAPWFDADPDGLAGHAFAQLNGAWWHDGALVRVAAGVRIPTPIQIVMLSGGADVAVHPRHVLILEDGAEASVVETYVGRGTYLCNPFTRISLGSNAGLSHAKLQLESQTAFHTGVFLAHQAPDSRLSSSSISLGAALARHDLFFSLNGRGASAELNGLYSGFGTQHVDHHTTVDHIAPHCLSQQIYRGVIGGTAHAVFNGRVVVHKDAQKTSAHQSNKNLVLSKGAAVDTKPELEILADDVKCSHGATVGQLDAGQLHYLRSRGIGREEAQSMLTRGFSQEALLKVPEAVRVLAENLIASRLREAA